jgi:hypothetical protein
MIPLNIVRPDPTKNGPSSCIWPAKSIDDLLSDRFVGGIRLRMRMLL